MKKVLNIFGKYTKKVLNMFGKHAKGALVFLSKYVEDIFIIGGLAVICGTTFFVNKIAGWYLVGVTFFGLGVYFAKFPLRR